MLLPFPFTPAELFLLQRIKRRFCSDERLRWLAHIPSLCVSTFCSMMHFSHARFSFFWGGLFCFVSCSCGHLHPLEWLRKNLTAFCPYTRNECWLGGLEGRLEQVLFSALPIQAHCLLERSGRDLWGLTEGILLGVWSDFTAKGTRSKKKKKRANTESLHTVALLCCAAEI